MTRIPSMISIGNRLPALYALAAVKRDVTSCTSRILYPFLTLVHSADPPLDLIRFQPALSNLRPLYLLDPACDLCYSGARAAAPPPADASRSLPPVTGLDLRLYFSALWTSSISRLPHGNSAPYYDEIMDSGLDSLVAMANRAIRRLRDSRSADLQCVHEFISRPSS